MKKLLLIFVLLFTACEPDYECVKCYKINSPTYIEREFCGTRYECKIFEDEMENEIGWVCQ